MNDKLLLAGFTLFSKLRANAMFCSGIFSFCTRLFIAEELSSWILPLPENSIMINGSKRYRESPNGKTGIESIPFHMVVLSLWKAFYWLKNSKKYGNHAHFLAILSLRFESNIFSRTQLERPGKITLSVDIIRVMFI